MSVTVKLLNNRQFRSVNFLLSVLFFVIVTLLYSCSKDPSAPTPPVVIDPPIIAEPQETVDFFLQTEDTASSVYQVKLYNKDYSLRWERDLPKGPIPFITYRPPLNKGLLLISNGYNLTAIKLSDGTTQWENANSFGYFLNLAVRNDTVFCNHVNTGEAYVEARNALTGLLFWRVAVPMLSDYAWGGAVDERHFYFLAMGNSPQVNAFDITKKELVWHTPVSLPHGDLLLANHQIYVPSYGLSRFTPATGEINWADHEVTANQPTFYKNFLICNKAEPSTTTAGVVAIDTTTGTIQWKRFNELSIASRAVSGDNLFVAGYEPSGQAVLFCSDILTGDIKWKREFDFVFDHLMVVDKVLYANIRRFTGPTGNSYTISFDAEHGKTLDSARIGRLMKIITASGKLLY